MRSIPPQEIVAAPLSEEPEQPGERRIEVEFDASPQVIIGYHKATLPHFDDYVFDVIDMLLSDGRTSRLYKVLVEEKKIAVSVSTANGLPGSRYPNLFSIFGTPRGPHTGEEVEQEIYNGEIRYYEVSIYPIWEKSGKISRFIHISRDITEQRQQEEEITRRLEQMVADRTRQLQETHAKLLHHDKMASLGRLSASVVHEINNPIAGVLNLAMLMKRIIGEAPLGPKEIEQFSFYLNLMETETWRISRIVSNLLAFSRQSRMEMKPLDLNRLIEQTLILNANLLKIANVRVETRLDPALPEIVGSEDQLKQVLMNLASNAAQAMEPKEGGLLLIESAPPAADGQVLVRITDTGVPRAALRSSSSCR